MNNKDQHAKNHTLINLIRNYFDVAKFGHAEQMAFLAAVHTSFIAASNMDQMDIDEHLARIKRLALDARKEFAEKM